MTANTPESKPASGQQPTTTVAIRVRNFLVAVAAIALTVAVFLGSHSQNPSAFLSKMASESTPLNVAIGNRKPTLLEFYANWCTTCQAMAPEMDALAKQYAEPMNFVMLNVDNIKWLPELERYRVDGIPHFVFLDSNGEAIAQTIGEQPSTVMEENIKALIAGLPLPHVQTTGQISRFEVPANSGSDRATDPRSHGSFSKS